jgi:hypothetical protein
MERNPTDNMGTSGTSGSGASNLGAGTDSLGVTGQGESQNATTGAYDAGGVGTSTDPLADSLTGGGTPGTSGAGANRLDQMRSTATDKLGQAREMAGERLGQAKEKATQLKATLADRLEAGANTLRERANTTGAGGAQLAGATAGTGSAAGILDNEQVQRLAAPAADAMQKTADFLRNGDLQESLEEQVRTNPGRTLLIALGVGYLLGKALRR